GAVNCLIRIPRQRGAMVELQVHRPRLSCAKRVSLRDRKLRGGDTNMSRAPPFGSSPRRGFFYDFSLKILNGAAGGLCAIRKRPSARSRNAISGPCPFANT